MSTYPSHDSGRQSSGEWYPSPGSASGAAAPPPAAPQGSPYGSPYGQSSPGTPYGLPANGTYHHHTGAPQPPSSGGGIIKWLVIGCVGCSGIAVLGFIALLLIGILGSDSATEGSSPAATEKSSISSSGSSDGGGEEPIDAPTEEPAAEEAATEEPAGFSGSSDAATLTVTSTERTQVLQDSIFEYSTSNEYFVVHIEYTNTSGEAQDLWAADLVLVDTDGKEYTTNRDVSLALENPIIIEEVNPGLTIQGTVVFEVPPGTEFSEMRLEESIGTSTSLTVEF